MAIFYEMPECEEGRHDDCPGFRPPKTEGGFDGWLCRCPCHSDDMKDDDVLNDETPA